AYWLITRGQFNLNFGSATITAAQDFFPITIGPGYSMIGNPFPYKVSWNNSRKGDSVQTVAWTYNGTTFIPESLALEPFTGYFVKNFSADSVTIYINPMDISTSPLPKSTLVQSYGENEWRISIAAYSGRSSDEINYAGVAKNAKREFDASDIFEPPATPTDYVIVRFNNEEWKKNSGHYAVDIRPVNENGEYWDFDVTTAKKQSKVKLSLVSLGNLPQDFEVFIIDKQSEIAQRVVNAIEYEFTMGKNESRRSFRLVVGKNSFIEENTGGIPLVPQNFALRQNYPNPFNPTTLIQYTLGHSGDVSVAIYNILGQRVRTLRNEFQSIGTYSLDWDGKDESGAVVASGVYFYKITVMSNGERLFAETKKMVLMK
ncbi:MAG: T9SS type A sorting domain-containing protein, partial [Ignavibacteriales bacterium]|nr:T9SS type A sorting domain-containing protein [Ignavibacteriales bacterium]